MKIAYIVPSLQNQGPIVVVKSLVDYLIQAGCVIDVFYFDDLPAMPFNCPTHHITMNECIDFDKYNIIHSHCLRPDRYVIKWKKCIHKAKIVTTLHQDTFRSFGYQYNLIISRLLTWYWCKLQSQFDGVVSISNQLKDIYVNKISTEMTTVYNGCSTDFDLTADKSIKDKLQQIKQKYKLLGTYAFVTRGKGLEQIIQLLVHLPEYAFAIIGEGPDILRLKQMAKQMNCSDRVFFFPYQRSPRNYLPYFDVYVMPSYSEGFGLSMVEAAFAKRAIVCSDIPSFREIFSSEETSFFELNNFTSLQEAVITAYVRKAQFGELAYCKAYEKFTSTKMAEKYIEYYEKAILK